MSENPQKSDHRNEGFNAKSAMFEHNTEKTALINKQIITKEGLKMYSDAECEQLSGKVIVSKVNEPVTWEEFQDYSIPEKKAYLEALQRMYDGISCADISKMMGPSHYWALREWCEKFNLPTGKRGRKSEGAMKFINEVLPKMNVSEEPTMEVVPVALPTPTVKGFIKFVDIECDADDLPAVIKQLGLVGKVSLRIEPVEERKNDNGFKQVI